MTRIPEQIRLNNLELLIAEAGSAVKLARRVGTNSSYLSQVRRRMPTQRGTPRGIGDDLAGKLEQGMGKSAGWMDEPHRAEWKQANLAGKDANVHLGPDLRSLHPVISWVQAGTWREIADDYQSQAGDEWLPCPVICSQDSYVLRVHGISMEPKFHDGDLLFVDPHIELVSGKYVVVILEDTAEATFKQLIIEGGHQYLKALNPEWPNRIIEVNHNARICGVVVFKGEMV
jgi:SOS-response transcriptional repressor LexA